MNLSRIHASMHAILLNYHRAMMPINLSGLLISIIIQDLIIHNKYLTNNNNNFNRSPVHRHDSRQLRVDCITAMWKHSDTRSVCVRRSVKGGRQFNNRGAAFYIDGGGGGGGGG